MKLFASILFLLFVSYSVFGQEFELNGFYSSSTIKEYKNNWGYGLGYNHFLKKNRFGISYSSYSYNTKYDDIHSSTVDGISKYILEYTPNNSRIAINLIYSNKLIDNEKSNLYLGCFVGLNYYKLHGEYSRIANGLINEGNFFYDYSINNCFGLGILIEYEIEDIISDKITTSMKISPELTGFEEFGTSGGYAPWVIGWLNFQIGIKYKLKDM